MEDLKNRIDELAELMEEFSLLEAQITGPDWKVAFRRRRKAVADPEAEALVEAELEVVPQAMAAPAADAKPSGVPVNSPMNGIYYSSPSPSAPPFVKVGEAVTAGEVVGLIEAMKVFNEIVAPITGTVERVVAENGQLVQPGDPLLYIS